MKVGKGNHYLIPYGNKNLFFHDYEEKVIFYAEPLQPATLQDSDALIDHALNNPIASTPLRNLVKTGDKVAILIDDITRPTPRKKLIAAILRQLNTIYELKISIIIALGTHRPMTQEEISQDLGEIYEKYPVINIDYRDNDRFVQVGTMPDNTPIEVYKEILDADFLIGVGNIVPHIAAGWGGGAKIVMPGVCSKTTTDAVHMLSLLQQNLIKTSGSTENLFRTTMETLASKVGLSFIVNTVIDHERNIRGVFAGDFIEAHRKGVEFAKTVLCPEISEKADILIVSANPANADFWQGAKPYIFAHTAVKQAGVMIFLLSAEEGLCGSAPAHQCAMRQYYDKSEDEIKKVLNQEDVSDKLGVAEAYIRIQTEGICKTILISEGLSETDATLLGFEKADSLDSAVKSARSIMGENATIGIIPHGGDVLCRLKEAVD